MTYMQRPYQNDADKLLMVELVHQALDDNLHFVDLLYRLNSWALDEPENTRLWFNEHKCLVAWAVMQTPFWSIDYAYRPDIGVPIHPRILSWADTKACNSTGTPYGRPAWFINVFDNQKNRMHDLKVAGFTSQADVGENSWGKVLMQRAAESTIGENHLPESFCIRPLKGKIEVDRYIELHQLTFESKNMTISWRARIRNQPDYIPDLDLVVEVPDGRMAGFCICWIKEIGNKVYGQIEPFGIHPDFRRLGLGSALLNEALKRMVKYKAETILVETDNYRNAAFALYEKAGFRVHRDVLIYRKDFVNKRGQV